MIGRTKRSKFLLPASVVALIVFAQDSGSGIYQEHSSPINIEKKAVPLTVSSGDIDNDGFPDIYISTFIRKSLFKKGTFNDPNHRTANIVLHNNRDYTFSDITQSSGLDYKQNTFYSRFGNLDND